MWSTVREVTELFISKTGRVTSVSNPRSLLLLVPVFVVLGDPGVETGLAVCPFDAV